MNDCEDFIQTDCTETGLDCGLVTGFDGFLYIIDVRTHEIIKEIDFGGESSLVQISAEKQKSVEESA